MMYCKKNDLKYVAPLQIESIGGPCRVQITIVLTRSLALQKKFYVIYHTSAILIKSVFFIMISRIFFSHRFIESRRTFKSKGIG